MTYYVGIDVSLESASVGCATGKCSLRPYEVDVAAGTEFCVFDVPRVTNGR
jgi:hypothetical protein